jgi:hypothetical protein
VTTWDYDRIRSRQGHKGRRGANAALSAAGALVAGTVGAVAANTITAPPAAAYVPPAKSLQRMLPRRVANEGLVNAPAMVLFAGRVHSELPDCDATSGTFASIVSKTAFWIDHGHQVNTEIVVSNGVMCGSPTKKAIGVWSTKTKDIVNSVEKSVEKNHGNFERYWGGVMFDEENSFGYGASTLSGFNARMQSYILSHGGNFETNALDALANLHGTIPGWTAAQDRSIVGNLRNVPQDYSAHQSNLDESACRMSGSRICSIIPTRNMNSTIPRMSADMHSKTIPLWGSKGWWYKWSLQG